MTEFPIELDDALGHCLGYRISTGLTSKKSLYQRVIALRLDRPGAVTPGFRACASDGIVESPAIVPLGNGLRDTTGYNAAANQMMP